MNPDAAADKAAPTVEILIDSPLWQDVPDAEPQIRRAIAAAARLAQPRQPSFANAVGERDVGGATPSSGAIPDAELCVLLCDDAMIAGLNACWRGRDGPTNVLSFPRAKPFLRDGPVSLGDIAMACETVVREARELGKAVGDHVAHLAVHGFLHLLGYDHIEDREAEAMELLESEILAEVGIPDPYAESIGRTGNDPRHSRDKTGSGPRQ